jgi:hypothetical protein
VEGSRTKACKTTVTQCAREVLRLKTELRCKEQELVRVRERLSALDKNMVRVQINLTQKIENLETIQNKVHEKTNQKIMELEAAKQLEQHLLQEQIERLQVEERQLRETEKQKTVEEVDLVKDLETIKSTGANFYSQQAKNNKTNGAQLPSLDSSKKHGIEPDAIIEPDSPTTYTHEKEGATKKEIKSKRHPTNESFSSTLREIQSENGLDSNHKDHRSHNADDSHSDQPIEMEDIQAKIDGNQIDVKSELSSTTDAKAAESDCGVSAESIEDDMKFQSTDPVLGSIRSDLSNLLTTKAAVESKHNREVDKLKAKLAVFLYNSSKKIEVLKKAKLAEERAHEDQITELKAEERELETDEAFKGIELRVIQSLQDEPDSVCSAEIQFKDISAHSKAKPQIDTAFKFIEHRLCRSICENSKKKTISVPLSSATVLSNTNSKATSNFGTYSEDEMATVPRNIDVGWGKSLLSTGTNVSTDTRQDHPAFLDENRDRTLLGRALCMGGFNDRLEAGPTPKAALAFKNELESVVAARTLSDDAENGTCGVNVFKPYISLWKTESPFASFLPSDNSILENSAPSGEITKSSKNTSHASCEKTNSGENTSDTCCEKKKSAKNTSGITGDLADEHQQHNDDDYLNPGDLNPAEAVTDGSDEKNEKKVIESDFQEAVKDSAKVLVRKAVQTLDAITETNSMPVASPKYTHQGPEKGVDGDVAGDVSNPAFEGDVVASVPNVDACKDMSHSERTEAATTMVTNSQQKPEDESIELSFGKETSVAETSAIRITETSAVRSRGKLAIVEDSSKEVHHDDDVRLRSDHGDEPIALHGPINFNTRVNSAPTKGTTSCLAQDDGAQDDGAKHERNKTSSMPGTFDVDSSSTKPVDRTGAPSDEPQEIKSAVLKTMTSQQDATSNTIGISTAHDVCASIGNDHHPTDDSMNQKSDGKHDQITAESIKAMESEICPDEKTKVIHSKLSGQSAEDGNLNATSATESKATHHDDRASIDDLPEEALNRSSSAEQRTRYEITREESVELELISQVILTPSPFDTSKAATTDEHHQPPKSTIKAANQIQQGDQIEQTLKRRTIDSTSKRPPLFKRAHSSGRPRIKALHDYIVKVRSTNNQPTHPHVDSLEKSSVKQGEPETGCPQQDEVDLKPAVERREASSSHHSNDVEERKNAEQKDASSFAAIVERTKASLGRVSDSSSSSDDSIILQVDQILSMISNAEISQARVESDLSDSEGTAAAGVHPDEGETREDEPPAATAAPPIVITFSGQGSQVGPTTRQRSDKSDRCSREQDIEVQFTADSEPSTTSHQGDKNKTRWQKYVKKLFRNKKRKEQQRKTLRKKATILNERRVGLPLSSCLGS